MLVLLTSLKDFMALLFVLGRIILGGYFIMSAYNHFKHQKNLAGYAAMKKIPAPKIAVMGSGVLLGLGGLSILFGVNPQAGIALLVLFLIPVTFMMHAFWKETDMNAKQSERIAFMKNAAIFGALLMMLSIALPWANSLN